MSNPTVYTLDVLESTSPEPAGGYDSTIRAADSANEPLLSALDAVPMRGDGIFETIGVIHGRPQALGPHLDRFARSADMLDLPAPHRDQWRYAVEHAAAALPADAQCSVRIALSRGAQGRATGWVIASVIGPPPAHHTPLKVVTLDRGLSSDAGSKPWLLAGAKTLSYAVNMAALREAERRGADDVIFTSSDGYVLEGPTSSVLARRGDTIVTPDTGLGILAGTSQKTAFDFFESAGFTTRYVRLRADELAECDALWLVSSVRLAAPVTQLDGERMPVDPSLSDRLLAALVARPD